MTITTYSVIEAIDAASLTTAVTAAIAGGKQPVGGLSILPDGRLCQAVIAGSPDVGMTVLDSAVTASAAELNVLDGVTAGTATASKGLVVGADKDLDTLAIVSAKVDVGTKTATATAGAATLNKRSGKVTSESLTTAAGADYTLTITNSAIAATDLVFPSVAKGTATEGTPQIVSTTPGAGSLVIVVRNVHASQAFNGTILVSFVALAA